MIEATGLGLRTRHGWVFRDVDLTVAAGEVAAVAGPSGSGRTMLLLALAGRARPSAGELRVGDAVSRPDIRRQVTVARATGAVELDPDLTVGDSRREAGLLFYGADLDRAEELAGLDLDSATVVGDLAPDDLALFSLALAAAGQPAALVLDDVDLRATPAQQHRIWAGLRAVAGTGIAVVASAVEVRQAGVVRTLRLGSDRAAV
ncbi:ATP-binding cassette domain-containing protein [Actinophytocola algeriensis]|uniref:ABC-type multidrug transport system ATPase subunit n=1 Tax=Actinophytocola algeriensis TaxID=1768010 RepID=A0A7W7QB05_9PSEU|nr:ATP-binding cassette domain-containing protein [Actinophytocola algeriensis]MBB4910322.1 ABC-type multidrug transport system ATPase subunit [Actinophytocola algeriensis]MBE1480689.1 ABC-type multidrug transport system ATPase subunit [Actinophytocola algeriensis]